MSLSLPRSDLVLASELVETLSFFSFFSAASALGVILKFCFALFCFCFFLVVIWGQ